MDQKKLNNQLIEASKIGELDMVKQLTEKGADVNHPDNNGYTPLIFASRYEYWGIVKYLVSHGADVNHANNNGYTPLILASRKGRLEIVKYLVEHGANVNQANNDGNTPLNAASANGYLEIIKYLVDHGANVNQANIDGETPLIWAIQYGQDDIIKYLVSRGADYTPIKNRSIFQDIIISESNNLKNKLTERYGLVKNIPGLNLPKDALLRTIYEEPYQQYCNPAGTGLPPIQLIALANILNNTLPKKRGMIEDGGKYEHINLDISWSELCDKVKKALYLLL